MDISLITQQKLVMHVAQLALLVMALQTLNVLFAQIISYL